MEPGASQMQSEWLYHVNHILDPKRTIFMLITHDLTYLGCTYLNIRDVFLLTCLLALFYTLEPTNSEALRQISSCEKITK